MVERTAVLAMDMSVQYRYNAFKALMVELLANPPATLSRDELYVIMNWCVGDMPEHPNKFTSLLKHHKMELESVWHAKTNRSCRGIKVQTWQVNPVFVAAAQQAIQQNQV
jgi:hypothetical protein